MHAAEASGTGILMLYSGVKNMLCFYNWLEAQIPTNIFFSKSGLTDAWNWETCIQKLREFLNIILEMCFTISYGVMCR
jgi:hypothetical protein